MPTGTSYFSSYFTHQLPEPVRNSKKSRPDARSLGAFGSRVLIGRWREYFLVTRPVNGTFVPKRSLKTRDGPNRIRP